MRETDYMQTREAYDAFVASLPEPARSQWWPVPWRLATPRERAVKVALWVGESIIVVGGALALGLLFSLWIEGMLMSTEQRDVCLKAANTGYDVRECYRGNYHDRGPASDLRGTGPAERGADR